MDIKNLFDYLVKDYSFTYQEQVFPNCYNGNGTVYTYSFYNDNGCFTIHSYPVRGELDFFCADRFSPIREELCGRWVDLRAIEKEIWDKHSKIGFLKRPFFWYSHDKILKAFSEVLKAHIEKYGEFFGIKVNSNH